MYMSMHHLVTSFDRREGSVFEWRQRLQDLVGLNMAEAGRGNPPQRPATALLGFDHLYTGNNIINMYYNTIKILLHCTYTIFFLVDMESTKNI